MHTSRASEGVRTCERALQLDRNLAGAYAQIGNGKLRLGEAQDTEAHIEEALRLSPRDTKLHLGKEEEAVAWLRRLVETNRNFSSSRFALAAALARLGRLAEARSEAQAGLAIHPQFTISRFRAGMWSNDATATDGPERVIDGLRKAGIPEE